MNRDPHEPNDLAQLFEQSAPSLDPSARGRLQAVAREIPGRRSSFWLSRWIGATAACTVLAAAALAVSALRMTPSEMPSAMRESAPALTSESERASGAEAEGEPGDEADELASSTDFDDASGPDVLDDLALDPGDLADHEVDAWISAANMTLGG
jgi:hypothetical protein